jgi:hypothetical protein
MVVVDWSPCSAGANAFALASASDGATGRGSLRSMDVDPEVTAQVAAAAPYTAFLGMEIV